ncbi:NADPH:quinone reductase [Nakamurella panacisegetis]|uniref:NADPH:quinone reductase n=1 Tax=Nakamurella panacisegetis TaxID=1090615 RepID=A0A1H0K0S1_9ACTN|nr:NADP-dependent oxidoreductase [Nakamurella panacisegetis]SDO49557.1 NADPH:quinone reductase [Nakamurella panacisegetis]
MRAIITTGHDDLQLIDTPIPTPGPGQLRLAVRAAGTNPVENTIRSGAFHRAGFITQTGTTGLGSDVAGTVDALGPDVLGPAVGTPVAAALDAFDVPLGAYAEYVVVDADSIAELPVGIDPVRGATVGINALTAEQALDLLSPQAGDRLLVTGAAGAVGGHAVTLATRRGWKVSGLARPDDADFLRSAGAVEVLTELGSAPRFDAAIDAAVLGAAVLEVVRDGGAYVGVRPGGAPESSRGISVTAVQSHRDGPRLAALLKLAASGELSIRVAGTLPLEEAGRALDLVAAGGQRGRRILVP